MASNALKKDVDSDEDGLSYLPDIGPHIFHVAA
jgi:hypothetical protein